MRTHGHATSPVLVLQPLHTLLRGDTAATPSPSPSRDGLVDERRPEALSREGSSAKLPRASWAPQHGGIRLLAKLSSSFRTKLRVMTLGYGVCSEYVLDDGLLGWVGVKSLKAMSTLLSQPGGPCNTWQSRHKTAQVSPAFFYD